ncbi:MAG: hypothetical protein GC154_00425 [bacterium]|nr:hypothetical protein [bacterium]
MKKRFQTLLLYYFLIAIGALGASADITLDRNGVTAVRHAESVAITLPFQFSETGRRIEDLKATLLDGGYQPISKLEKKIVILNGKGVEEIALPIASNAPALDQCTLRIDLMGQVWLKPLGTEQDSQEIQLVGQTEWIEGGRSVVRAIVTNGRDGAPIEGAEVSAELARGGEAVIRVEARTDSGGAAELVFNRLDGLNGEYVLSLHVRSKLGDNSLESRVTVKPGVKIFLTTDKPVYQPRQTIHIRGLIAHQMSNKPLAGRTVTLEVYDGRGNKVFKQNEKASEFGVVSADFQLADEVNQGDYLVKAISGETEFEKGVQVYEYVLPKFRVDVKTERSFYAPGETVKGSLESRYFFGKPVDGAAVKIVANCFDIGFNEFVTVDGKTNNEGKFEFSFVLPDRLVGQPLFKGNALIQLDTRVRDSADHEEQKIHTFHAASDPLEVDLIPESGVLTAGVENEVYLVASYPDGSVAKPSLSIKSSALKQDIKVKCNDDGIAVLYVTPKEKEPVALTIEANLDGKTISLNKEVPVTATEDSLLLRPDKAVYRVGDVMTVNVFSPNQKGEAVYLDIIKDGQTQLTHTLRPENGRAQIKQPITHDLSGTIELNAYRIRSDGNMVSDNRRVIALRSDDLRIEITPDLDQYAPGQPARLKIAVRDSAGQPVQAALGMNIVDESVYSLSEKELGLAKVFFAIERELLQPKVEIHGYKLDKAISLSPMPLEKEDSLAKALLSRLDNPDSSRMIVDTGVEKRRRVQTDLQALGQKMAELGLQPDGSNPRGENFFDHPMTAGEALLRLDGDLNDLPLKDPWGRPYAIYRTSGGELSLASVGPDELADTQDDETQTLQSILPRMRVLGLGRGGERLLMLRRGGAVQERLLDEGAIILEEREALGREPALAKGIEPGAVQLQGGGFGGYGMRGIDRLDMAAAPDAPAINYKLVKQQPGIMALDGPPGVSSNVQDTGIGAEGGAQPQDSQWGFEPGDDADGIMVQDRFGAVHPSNGDINNDGVSNLATSAAIAQADNQDKSVYYDYSAQSEDKANRPEADPIYQSLQKEVPFDLLKPQDDAALPAAGMNDLFSFIVSATDSLGERSEALWGEFQQEMGLQDENLGPLYAGGVVNEKALQAAAEKALEKHGGQLDQTVQQTLASLREKFSELSDASASVKPAERAVRVRRYFPETLYYTPELITDERGEAQLNLPMADSITTWRLSAMANAKSGALGDATAAMKVFKPFFIDLDLPVFLTRGDEVTIPVAVYNYLDKPQEVEVSLEKAGWFDLLEGDLKRDVKVAAHEVTSVSYRIQASQLGDKPLTVFAWGSEDADAISRTIEVRPNGEPRFVNFNGRLESAVEERFSLPPNRLQGADRLWVKIYPGIFSQVVEGMDALLQMPYGCFEQTSSTTYPNILAMRYMRDSERITPAIEMKAREYINLGYQRLLTFEIPGGGFSVFGQAPATRVLSAYGLMEFGDMNEVYPIDENVLARTKNWLMGQRNADGSWEPDSNYAHAEMWKSIQDNKTLVTAYIALALANAGAGELSTTTQYLLDHARSADDAYTLSILCNALLKLAPKNPVTLEAMRRLIDMAVVENDKQYWKCDASMSFARGEHAWVEVTAWAALAAIESGRYPAELSRTLNWLISVKSPNGAWSTTHGTVLALKALIGSLGARTSLGDGTAVVAVNGREAGRIEITPDNADVFHQIDATRFLNEGENKVELTMNGEGSMMYQIVGKYFEGFGGIVPLHGPVSGSAIQTSQLINKAFDIQVEYDRTELRRNDRVTCHVSATNNRPEQAQMVMIDVGVPPGFQVERPQLDEYVDKGTIAKYSATARQVLIYIESMKGGETLKIDVPMKATLPVVAKAPASSVYEYYNPEVKSISPPQDMIVD